MGDVDGVKEGLRLEKGEMRMRRREERTRRTGNLTEKERRARKVGEGSPV